MNLTVPTIDWMAVLAVAASAAVMVFLLRRMMRGMNQQDWILLRQARTRGIKLTDPQSVDFILFLPSEDVSVTVAAELRNEGFESSAKFAEIQYVRGKKKPGAAQPGYVVTATRTIALEPAELIKMRARFNEIAKARRGVYCGWQIASRAPQSG